MSKKAKDAEHLYGLRPSISFSHLRNELVYKVTKLFGFTMKHQ